MLGKTVPARFRKEMLTKGALELLEPVELEDGKRVTVTIIEFGGPANREASMRAAGSWAGNVDVDAFLKDRARVKRIRKRRIRL